MVIDRPEFTVCDVIPVPVLHFVPDGNERTLDISAVQNRKLTKMTFISICQKEISD